MTKIHDTDSFTTKTSFVKKTHLFPPKVNRGALEVHRLTIDLTKVPLNDKGIAVRLFNTTNFTYIKDVIVINDNTPNIAMAVSLARISNEDMALDQATESFFDIDNALITVGNIIPAYSLGASGKKTMQEVRTDYANFYPQVESDNYCLVFLNNNANPVVNSINTGKLDVAIEYYTNIYPVSL